MPFQTPAIARPFVERVANIPAGADARRWTIRDDNNQHHHGVVPFKPGPLYLTLFWKAASDSSEQLIGTYRLHLAHLLSGGFIRAEGESSPVTEVRLRFVRDGTDVIYIQARASGPRLPLPHVAR